MAGCAAPQTPSQSATAEPSFAIRNVRIFDGERVIPSGAVLVQGDRIVAVGEDIDLSGVAEVIDGQGQTLLPGLIDAHFHVEGPDSYRAALAYGITTVVDMFGQLSTTLTKTNLRTLSARASDEADPLLGPVITAPGGHGDEFPGIPVDKITTPQECQSAVNAEVEAGAAFIKLVYDAGETWSQKAVPTLSREALATCIEAAHARGLQAIVHVMSLKRSREVIEAGADGLSHAINDTTPDAAFFELAAARGVFVVPTLAVTAGGAHQRNDTSILADPLLEPYLSPDSLKTLKATFPQDFGHGVKPSVSQEVVRQLKAARVPVLAGSDSGNPQTAVGASLHQELELLVAAGLTPLEALAAATRLPAIHFRMSDRGRIAPGLRADLLLVQGDPTKDIRMTRSIVAVWKRGKKLDRDAYRARITAARQEGARP
jgi:imidazolonepropionase-like amidohydrolase